MSFPVLRATIAVAVALVSASVMTPSATADAHLRDHHSRTIADLYSENSIDWSLSTAPCGIPQDQIGGCYDHWHVYLAYESAEDPAWVTYALWHEFHHYLDIISGVPYTGGANECAADAFAFAHDPAAIGQGWGYLCENGLPTVSIPGQ